MGRRESARNWLPHWRAVTWLFASTTKNGHYRNQSLLWGATVVQNGAQDPSFWVAIGQMVEEECETLLGHLVQRTSLQGSRSVMKAYRLRYATLNVCTSLKRAISARRRSRAYRLTATDISRMTTMLMSQCRRLVKPTFRSRDRIKVKKTVQIATQRTYNPKDAEDVMMGITTPYM